MRTCELVKVCWWLGGRQATEERPAHCSPSTTGPRAPVCDTITMKTVLFGLLLVVATVLIPGAQAYPVPDFQLTQGENPASVNSDVSQIVKRLYIIKKMLKSKQMEKRGPGGCINSCLTGGMSFVRCRSMCR